MADKRAYAKFDIGYLDNPKMLPVLDESPTAVLVHAVSVLYAAQHLTDGHVPCKSMLRKVGGTQDDADLLVREGVWHRPGHDCEECPQPVGMDVYVHNFLEHNRAAAEVNKAKTAAKTAADARWGKTPDDADRNADRNADRMRTASGSHSGSHADRNAVFPESQCLEREKERETYNPHSDPEQEFADWWQHYPKKVDKGQARKAYKTALKKADPDTLTAGAKAYAATVTDTEKRFIKNPSTWLNAEAWNNTTTQAPPRPTGWDYGPEAYMHPEEIEYERRATGSR